ncbi:MAG: hypothetical protein N2053_05655, partial [Chitinispirillaceae bacterium]|nr:hypothetical protein [Chitinispirillaceae bacterium]
VWHGKLPAESVWKYKYRFWSEFGMQSYCYKDTALMFTEERELNIFSPSMENHQKHPLGNLLIFQYLAYRYRFPKDFDSIVYLSQVNQVYCVSLMVEHQRALMPKCMGSLYWQLNDCWPAISWSSIDFSGKWKGLHYAACKFFSPILVTYRLIGEEYIGKINRRINNITGVEIITVYEGKKEMDILLCWDIYSIPKSTIEFHGEKNITLIPAKATVWKELDMKNIFRSYPKNSIVLRLLLKREEKILAEKSVFFTAPKNIDFPKEDIIPQVKEIDFNTFELTLETKTFQHMVYLDIPHKKVVFSDNFFDIYPSEKYNIKLKIDSKERIEKNWLLNNLKLMTLRDSY